MGIDRNAIAPLQPGEHNGEMLVIDAVEQGFVAGLVLGPLQRRVFLAQPVQRGGQFDVILAVAGGDRNGSVARRIVHFQSAAGAAIAAQQKTALRRIDLGHRHHIARRRRALLCGLFALDEEDRPGARRLAADHQFVAFVKPFA